DGLAGAHLPAAVDRVIGGMRRDHEARGVGVGERVRHRVEHGRDVRGGGREASERLRREAHHALADPLREALRRLFDDADGLLTRHVRPVDRHRVLAGRHRHVGRGQRGREHAHEHVRLGRRLVADASAQAGEVDRERAHRLVAPLRRLAPFEHLARATDAAHDPRLHSASRCAALRGFARSRPAAYLELMRRVVGVALVLFATACSPVPRPGSALISVVATRPADHLGVYGYSRATSPALDALAARGLVFDRAYSTSPWTLPSFGSLLTGHPPSEHLAGLRVTVDGTPSFTPLSNAMPTLAELLSVRYWATGAVVNNPFLTARSGIARGFDRYDYRESERRAAASAAAPLAWIAARGDRPFFAMLPLFAPHLPYDAPAPFRERFTGPRPPGEQRPDAAQIRAAHGRGEPIDVEFLRGAYDEEIAFVDRELGRLFAELESRGLLAKTLVIFTADHGEEFLDHGGFEHGHAVFDEVVRVPLVIWGPGVAPGRSDAVVSLRDVPATVLGAFAIAPPPGFPGRSLLDAEAE